MEKAANNILRYDIGRIHRFCVDCLIAAGGSSKEANVVSDVICSADLRGKESHGVARLRRYAMGLKNGIIAANVSPKLITDTPGTAVIDALNGLGQPACVEGMNIAISKAKNNGIGAVAIRNSNHFGIAGYYAALASNKKMVGISMTNASPAVAPTFSSEPIYGTNPIGISFPTSGTTPFIIDMATSIVPRGKLEKMSWYDKRIPTGWGIDSQGRETDNNLELINGLKKHLGYALLPLGGAGELFSGHKGYALGIFVDLFCGPLAGSMWGKRVYGPEGARLGQWMIAINVGAFTDLNIFMSQIKLFIDDLQSAKKVDGEDRIFIPGEKSFEVESRRRKLGVPIPSEVFNDIMDLGKNLGVKL